ncbi:MAG: Ig-like domain-containing protein [Bacteroidetes bacterium]|nr:Ig-like domain-containing protein [Bacteroidota bacterium]
MKRNPFIRHIPVFLIILFFIQQILVVSGCAVIVPPQGGPKDTIPPVLVKVTPPDSSKNFTETKINLTFDEYIQLQGLQESLVVSPNPLITPVVEAKLKTISIRLKDSLEPNTTYTIDFGKAIRDLNEGNIAQNFTYTFSTGNYIDSLELKGKVILAENGKIDSTLIVLLHKNTDDSAIIKDRPRYVAKLDGKGNFHFKNLPSGTFALYAMKDVGGQKKFTGRAQLFAFADSLIITADHPAPVTLYAFTDNENGLPAKTSTSSSAPKNNPSPPSKDKNKENQNRLRLQTNSAGNQDLLSDFTISTEKPFRKFDTALVHFYTDSTYTPVKNYTLTLDSTRTSFTLHVNWLENQPYHLVLEKEFADDSTGKMLLKPDTISFFTRKKSDYGSLRVRFKNLDESKNNVVQILQADKIVQSIPLTGKEFFIPMMLPSEYSFRLLDDKNKNGVWDPGQFFGKRHQPEIVSPIERKVTVKGNWDNEVEISL